ncbi:helix-turn-helix domain-containing protein [Streptosporangium sandarakinum]|uniref:helix-turn-helix domain-containing protein n=1 Tax=Streptosporangium sandarakinum TaxID=1260955 RepID=UPI003D89E299
MSIRNAEDQLPAYKPKQAAEVMNVHINTVYRMIADGRLKTVRAGRAHRIPAGELAPFRDGQAA